MNDIYNENKFCFVAIVKDESHVIKRCLDSVANIATSYLICDTGSTDNTPQIITEYMNEKNIPGEVIHKQWKNYSYNRSYLMEQAFTYNKSKNAKYIIWHDADEVFIKNPNDPLSYPTVEDANNLYNWLESCTQSIIYIKTIYNNCHYKRWNIVRNNQLYVWKSPKHEWLLGTIDNSTIYYDKFILLARQQGNASKDPNRCQKDSILFLDYINENGGPVKCGREIFYLAEEYESFDKNKAIKYYKIKTKLPNQWYQEIYISYLRLGRLCDDEYSKIKYWKAGFKVIPKRLECIHQIVKYYMSQSKFDRALKWACQANENRIIDIEDLFVESNTYEYNFDLDYSVAAHYNGQNELASLINQKNMLRNKNKPIMEQLLINQKFIEEKIINDKLMNLTIYNKIMKNEHQPTYFVIDDFYENIDEIRKIALDQPFDDVGNYPGGRTKSFASEELKQRFEIIIGKKITYWPEQYNGSFQITNKDNVSWIHRDKTNYSVVIFLTPNAPINSGTILYSHKASGLRCASNDKEEELLSNDSSNDDAWNQIDIIGNIYNRCLIFNGKTTHKSNVYFGDTKDNSRLTQTFFFD